MLFFLNIFHDNNYQDVWEVPEDRHIKINDETIVYPMVLDYNEIHSYLVGIRLPVLTYSCSATVDLLITNEKVFFIWDFNSQQLKEFNSKSDFKFELKNLGIEDKVHLNYKKFEDSYNYYSPFYNDENRKCNTQLK